MLPFRSTRLFFTGKPILSKSTRRAIYWMLLLVAIGAPAVMIGLSLRGDPIERHYFTLLRLTVASISMLLFWSVAYITTEPFLVQIVLAVLALLLFVFACTATLPQF